MSTTRIQTYGFMSRIRAVLGRLRRDRRGATTVEYIALVAFLALGTIAVVKGIRDSINTVGKDVGTKVGTLTPGYDQK